MIKLYDRRGQQVLLGRHGAHSLLEKRPHSETQSLFRKTKPSTQLWTPTNLKTPRTNNPPHKDDANPSGLSGKILGILGHCGGYCSGHADPDQYCRIKRSDCASFRFQSGRLFLSFAAKANPMDALPPTATSSPEWVIEEPTRAASRFYALRPRTALLHTSSHPPEHEWRRDAG